MGMFDYVRSDYEIFGNPIDQDLQSKSFECMLETIYISKAGEIFRCNLNNTFRLETSDEMPLFRTIPTGDNGRVEALTGFSGTVRLSGSNERGDYCSAVLAVENGRVKKIIEIFP